MTAVTENSGGDAQDLRSTGVPWGFWWTTVFAILVAVVYLIVALLPAGLIIAARYPGGSVETASKLIQSTVAEGFYLAIVSIATAFVCGGLIFLLAGVRKGISVSDYLGLKSPRSTAIFKWLGVAVALWALCDTSSVLLKRNVVPDFMVKAYLTAGSVPLFWLGIAVAAPVFEELFFIGFIFAGWARSRLRPTGTIFLTAALWAAIHQQYDFYDMTMIGVMGILLGFARLQTGSLYTPILMHCLQNLIATTELWLFARNGV